MRVLDLKDKRYWKLMISIGLPIALQNLIFNGLNMVDNILIGGLGEANIAAVGIANKLSFVFNLFLFGINSGANIFSAQFWGKKDLQGVRRVLGLSLLLGMTVAVPFTLVGVMSPEWFIGIFSKDQLVIGQGASYLRIAALSFPISAITSSYGMQSRGVGRTKIPLMSSASALALNTILTYLLIYGKLGLPEMSVAGAALATLFARALECGLLVGMIYKNKFELAARFSEFSGYTGMFLKRFAKSVTPVITNEVLWAVGVTGYTYFYGRLGTEAVATVQILDLVNGIFFSLFAGICNACGAIIGNKIGAGEDDTARVYAKRSVVVVMALGALAGGLMVIVTPLFLNLFNISAETRELCRITVLVYAAFNVPRVTNTVMVVGVCRGGGDTLFAMAVDVLAPWLIGLPMAYLGVEVFGFPIYLVMAMIYTEEVVKSIFSIARLLSNKWLHNLVRDIPQGEDTAADTGSS